jgi:ribonucleoside-diphosphate reductase alpha chain
MGYRYGSAAYIETQSFFLERLRDIAYRQSIVSAATKGAFPAFDEEKYLSGKFIKTLPDDIQWGIKCYGVRNSHLTSIAPTGTISMCADNVSSGIEPPYSLTGKRLVIMPEGKREIDFSDYAFANHGVRGKTAMEVTAEDHIKVLCAAQKYVDSSVSKTCNVLGQKKGQPGGVSFSDFKKLYTMAYEGGAKGCSTFNANGKRAGIITADNNPEETEGAACFVDPSTGVRSCE